MGADPLTQLPPGFELDQAVATLPPGFAMDTAPASPQQPYSEPPVGLTIPNPPTLEEMNTVASRGDLIERLHTESGIPRGELIAAIATIDNDPENTGPVREHRVKEWVSRRQYEGFWDELSRSWVSFSDRAAAAGLGAAAQTLRAGAVAPGAWYTRTPETTAATLGTAREIETWAQRLWEDSRSEKYQPGEGGGFPGFVARVAGSVVPFVGLSLTAGLTGGPIAAFGVSATVEGDDLYRQALADGATEDQANLTRFVGGSIIGMLEVLELNKLVRLGKTVGRETISEFVQAATHRSMQKMLAAGGKLTRAQAQTAVYEGFIETLQGWAGEGTAIVVYGKDFDPAGLLESGAMDFAGGTVGSLMMGPAFIVFNGETETAEGQAEPPKPPMVMTEDEYAAFDAKQPTAAAEPAVPGEAPAAPVAARAEEAAPGPAEAAVAPEVMTLPASPESQAMWDRLNSVEPFVPTNEAEADLMEAHDAGIIQSPQDVVEWMGPGSTTEAIAPEVRAPSADPQLTSARQEWLVRDRAEMGREPINSAERRGWQEALDTAKAEGIPDRAMRIAQDVMENARPLTDIETAGMDMQMARLKSEYGAVMQKLSEARETAETATLAAEAERIESEYDIISRAVHLAGSEKGRALAAQKLTIDENYDLISVKTRAKAKKGKALDPKEAARLEKLTAEHARMTEEVEALRKQVEAARAEREARRPARRRSKKGEATSREARLAENYAKLKALLEAGC